MSQSEESEGSSKTPEPRRIVGPNKFVRKYIEDIPGPDNTIFSLRTLSYGELKRCAVTPPGYHFVAAVSLSMVDEKYDTIWVQSDSDSEWLESLGHFDAEPSIHVEAWIEAVKAYVLNSIDYEELAKNS